MRTRLARRIAVRSQREAARSLVGLSLSLLILGGATGEARAAVRGVGAEFEGSVAILLTPAFSPNLVWFSLQPNRRVVFEASNLDHGKRGLYITGGPEGYTPIFEAGDPAPSLPGFTFLTGPLEWVAANGVYAFLVFLDGPGVDSSNDIAVYAGRLGSGHDLLFREGDPVPDAPGHTFTYGATDLRVDSQGNVLLLASFAPSGGGLMYGSPGDLRTVAGVGDPAPGRPTETFVGFQSMVMNNQGTIAFVGLTDGGGRGVWSGPPEALDLELFSGDPVVDTSDTMSLIRDVSLTASGAFTVRADLAIAGSQVLVSLLPATPRLVFESHAVLYRPTTSAYGLVAFESGSGTDVAIYAEQSATIGLLTLLAHWGDPAPDLPAGVEFADFLGEPIINRFEQVAFPAFLRGAGVDPSNDLSLWIHDPMLGTRAVAREGSTIRIAEGDTRTIETLHHNLSSYQGGLQNGGQELFNLYGELGFQADFTDGTSAIVLGRQPSPAILFDGFESGDTSSWSASSGN